MCDFVEKNTHQPGSRGTEKEGKFRVVVLISYTLFKHFVGLQEPNTNSSYLKTIRFEMDVKMRRNNSLYGLPEGNYFTL